MLAFDSQSAAIITLNNEMVSACSHHDLLLLLCPPPILPFPLPSPPLPPTSPAALQVLYMREVSKYLSLVLPPHLLPP